MTYGLQLRDSAGALKYSSDDVTWNQVDFFYVAGGSSAGNQYPVIEGREVLIVQMFINPPPVDRRAIAHTTIYAGQMVYVFGGSEDVYVLVLMR